MPRGRYQSVSAVDRERLVSAYERDRDWGSLAEELSIKRQTARSIIMAFRRSNRREALPKGGHRPRCLPPDMIERAVGYVEEKPSITLREILERLTNDYPAWNPCTIQTISRALDGQLITLKIARGVPHQWNAPNVKEDRRGYAQWMMGAGLEENLIFVDEMGANVWTARTQGRARRGQRAVNIIEGQRGKNLTLCLAVSPTWGLVHWTFVKGGMTNDKFSDFLIELSTLIEEPFTVLFDNARSHYTIPQMDEGHNHRKLPPYSPFLNMTERAISSLKAALKRSLGEPDIQRELGDREAARAEGIALQDYRLRILRRELERNLDVVTQQKCQQWNNRSLQYVPDCLQLRDIFA